MGQPPPVAGDFGGAADARSRGVSPALAAPGGRPRGDPVGRRWPHVRLSRWVRSRWWCMRPPSAISRPMRNIRHPPWIAIWRPRGACWNWRARAARGGCCSPVPARSTASSRPTLSHIPEDYPGAPLAHRHEARHTGRASASRNTCARCYGQVYGFDAVIGAAVRVRRPAVCRWTPISPWATSSATRWRAVRCGSRATARPTALICTRRTWRSGCGRC